MATLVVVPSQPAPAEAEQLALFEGWGVDVARLKKARQALIERPGATATAQAYAADWASWISWCKAAGRSALPGTAESVELYVVDHAQRGASLGTLRRRLTGIRAGHRAAGSEPPATAGALKVIRELARDGKGRPKPKAALTVENVAGMVRTLDLTSAIGVRDRAVLLLGLAAGLRRSEISSLDLSDVKFERRGIELLIRKSKTDQTGVGRVVAVWRGKRRELCPVAALDAWIRRRGRWAGPLFTSWRGTVATHERLTGDGVHDLVVRAAVAIGLEAELYGAHSLRAGCVTAAIRAGASLPAIMARTGHRSVQTLSGYYRPAGVWAAGDPLAGAL